VMGIETLPGFTTPDSLDRKKGRGGKREGAGRKKKGTPTQVSTPMLAIRPSPLQGNGTPILSEDPARVFQGIRTQVQLQGPPYLSRHPDAPSSPEKEDDITIDELVALVVALNQKFVRYARRESQFRQQFFTLKKEKEELHWRLAEALKAKETLEQQLSNTRIEDQYLFPKSDKNGHEGSSSSLNSEESQALVDSSQQADNHVHPLANSEFSTDSNLVSKDTMSTEQSAQE